MRLSLDQLRSQDRVTHSSPDPVSLSLAQGLKTPSATTLMLLWGLTVALLGGLLLLAVAPADWPTFGFRITDLDNEMTVIREGGQLFFARHGARGSLYLVGTNDDEGIYVFVPLLTRLFGLASPLSMFRYAYVFFWSLALAAYPLAFYRLTRSTLAGIAAPLALFVCVLSMGFNNLYWIPAWAALALLPIIFLLARDWPRFGLAALVVISLIASLLSSIRGDSGLGIAITAAIVLLLRRMRWWLALASLILLAVAYMAIPLFVLDPLNAHRDSEIRGTPLSHEQLKSHPLWHTSYIGLGYLPNNYGIFYSDGVAAARVQREAPGTVYLSRRYASVLKKAYFDVVQDHPVEVVKQYAAKVIVTIADLIPYLSIVLLTAPAMLLLGPERRIRRRWLLLALPTAILGFLPMMIAIPSEGYEQGLYGVVGVVGIVGICWLLAEVEVSAHKQGGLRRMLAMPPTSWLGDHNQLRRSVCISCVALAACIPVLVGGHFIRQSADRWQHAYSAVLVEYLWP